MAYLSDSTSSSVGTLRFLPRRLEFHIEIVGLFDVLRTDPASGPALVVLIPLSCPPQTVDLM
jgi:hypothetical protein